jgi:hypothetical protein
VEEVLALKKEVGESYTEGDVFAEEDWGPPIENSGEKERDDKGGGDKEEMLGGGANETPK